MSMRDFLEILASWNLIWRGGGPLRFRNFFSSSGVYKSISVLSCQDKVGSRYSHSYLPLAPGPCHLASKVDLRKQFLHIIRSMDTMTSGLMGYEVCLLSWPRGSSAPLCNDSWGLLFLLFKVRTEDGWTEDIPLGLDIRENFPTETEAELQTHWPHWG